MSLLDNLPHKCLLRRRVRAADALGGSKDAWVVVREDVPCWEQRASDNEMLEHQKRGIAINRKVYFAEDPGVDERYQIVVTERMGRPVVATVPMDVRTAPQPDADVGFGLLYRVMANDAGE